MHIKFRSNWERYQRALFRNILVSLLLVGYFLLGVILLNTSAVSNKINTPDKIGDNTYP